MKNRITCVIPTSPIPSHPSMRLIDGAVESIRKHIPDIPILVQVDGLREENANRREQYEEYKRVLPVKALQWGNTKIHFFSEYKHQAEMMRETFDEIDTPLLFYLEHDWEILDLPIDWAGIVNAVECKELNLVRLYRWDAIVPGHEYLMNGESVYHGVPVIRTVQWSGHPHVASVEFYEDLIAQFRVGCRTLIEEFIYGPVVNAPWDEYRCAIYNPFGGMRRIQHTDGREADPKFDAQF